jgi:hypothetical protein
LIAFVSMIHLTFWPPPESVLSDTPWHLQKIQLITREPDEEDINLDLEINYYRKHLRIMEIQPEDAPQ